MFEFEGDIVEHLLKENKNFVRLYNKHDRLKRRVDGAHIGKEHLDDFSLETLKKEKLVLKDKMAKLIEHHRHSPS